VQINCHVLIKFVVVFCGMDIFVGYIAATTVFIIIIEKNVKLVYNILLFSVTMVAMSHRQRLSYIILKN